MDLPLYPSWPRLLPSCGVRNVSRRPKFLDLEPTRKFTRVRDRSFVMYLAARSDAGVCNVRGRRECNCRQSVSRFPCCNLDCRLTRFVSSYGVASRGRLPGRRDFGVVVRFEEENKNCIDGNASSVEEGERPPFNLDLAVVLAGFAFEAYNTPRHFLREIYDGQIIVKLKRGMYFPGLDLWGTSDPYVVLRCGDCEARSKVVWATRDPVWNEEFKLNIKNPASQFLKIAAWDANIITAHRRMGNTRLSLEKLSNGKKHAVELQLEGMGGGGAVQLEIQYKSFSDLDSEKNWWRLPSLTDFLDIRGVEGAYKKMFGEEGIKAGDFVESILTSLPVWFQEKESNTLEDAPSPTTISEKLLEEGSQRLNGFPSAATKSGMQDRNDKSVVDTTKRTDSAGDRSGTKAQSAQGFGWFDFEKSVHEDTSSKANVNPEGDDEGDFVRAVMSAVGKTLALLGMDVEGIPPLNRDTLQADREAAKQLGLKLQRKAEAEYVKNGLALPSRQVPETSAMSDSQDLGPSSEQLEKSSKSMLRNTEDFLGLLAMVARSFPGGQSQEEESRSLNASETHVKTKQPVLQGIETFKDPERECKDGQVNEAKRQMFQTAESAVEAWAMLATSLGGQSFVKSEFEKICFLENRRTDTEVAIWRDLRRCRLVIAFRGTEQTKWKDLSTDINVIPVGFNPERIGGNFNEEVMVHGGFLNAYDSVRRRLMTMVQTSLGIRDVDNDPAQSWQVYTTGHSLGGALATLFALELSSSKLAKDGHIQVTMYNFGSPRVGNKRFADLYNQKVKDSWRIVNHRDIIPTVPRLMGYCHVAQPIYLSAGALNDALVERDLLEDGYQGDVIGEVTPDFVLETVVNERESKMLERLLETEIAMLRAIRDGSALMQHMEDFYYIALLERVEQKMSRRS